jgi:hypothetical protein
MLETMAPILLKSLLLKVFPTANVTGVGMGKPTAKGTQVMELDFVTTYPEEWIKYDRETYGHKI